MLGCHCCVSEHTLAIYSHGHSSKYHSSTRHWPFKSPLNPPSLHTPNPVLDKSLHQPHRSSAVHSSQLLYALQLTSGRWRWDRWAWQLYVCIYVSIIGSYTFRGPQPLHSVSTYPLWTLNHHPQALNHHPQALNHHPQALKRPKEPQLPPTWTNVISGDPPQALAKGIALWVQARIHTSLL